MAKPVSLNSIEVLWAGDSAADSFEVYRSIEQSGILDTIATTRDTSVLDRDLAPGTLYTYRIRARNEHGVSSFSNLASARTPMATPAILEARYIPPDSIGLRWGSVAGAMTYRILCSRDSLQETVLHETRDTTWGDYAAALRGTYVFRIEALDYDFQSRISDTASFQISAGWSPVGANLTPDTAYNLSLCIDQGIPYVSFIDFSQGKKASVISHRNGTWQYLGTPGVSSGRVDYSSMDVSNGVPWLTYCDYGRSYRAIVARFQNGGWEYVGDGCSFGAVDFPVIKVNNGTPYVAYVDYINSKNITVVTYNGSAWETVGRPGFTMAKANMPIVFSVSGGLPYIGCSSPYGSEDHVFLWKLGAGDWELFGGGPVSGGPSYNPAICFGGGLAYVSYADFSQANAISVSKSSGGGWSNVGEPGMSSTPSGLSSICEADGALYIAYVEAKEGERGYPVVVKKWNGSRWQSLGSVGTTCGVLFNGNPFPLIPTIAIRVDSGIPYVAFSDATNGAKAVVLRYIFSK